MNFSNEKYKNVALNYKFNEEDVHTPEEAFMLLINGVDKEVIDNLVDLLASKLNLTTKQAYLMTQISGAQDYQKFILETAYECLETKPLGNKTINDGKINLSDWLNHSLNVGLVCKNLAATAGDNANVAQTMGILHDFGRKYDHSFKHTILGAEKLMDLGWTAEAMGCLSHSFIANGRCANNEKAVEGFALDSAGNPYWTAGTKKDDMTEFLENYQYSEYDDYLNMADLTATGHGITSPYDRIQDIATRREIDPTNRKYFFAETINLFNNYMRRVGLTSEERVFKATPDISLEEMDESLRKTSSDFDNFYQNRSSIISNELDTMFLFEGSHGCRRTSNDALDPSVFDSIEYRPVITKR